MNKIQISHLLTIPEDEREINSVKDITKLCNNNNSLDYYQIINQPYIDTPPNHNVIFGNKSWVKGKSKPYGTWGLTSGHYGCYLAHINTIQNFFKQEKYNTLLVIESDCKIKDFNIINEKIYEAQKTLENTNYKLFSFVEPNHQSTTKHISGDIYECDLIICAHMYMIHKKDAIFYENIIKKYGWHTYDWWINMVFEKEKEKILCFKELKLTTQYEGESQIDRK